MRWRILALLFLARVGLGLQFQSLGSVGDDLVRAFGFDYAEIGTLIGFFMLPGMFLALPAGFAGQYLSDRLLIFLGLCALALGGFLAALAGGFGLLAAGRIACGQIVDRTRRPDLVLYICMAAAMASLALLGETGLAVPLSLVFGLMGMAPAGVIMALTGEAMKAENRALGMGVFFTSYFLIVGPAPAIAGWLYDWTGDPYLSILFAAALFGLTGLGNLTFRRAQRLLARN